MNPTLMTLMFQTVAASSAVALVALLRAPLMRAFDARAAYLLWLCVPVAMAVAALPPPLRIAAPPLAALQQWAAPAPMPVTTTAAAALAATTGPSAAQVVTAVWAGGAALLALLLFLRQHRFSRSLRSQPPGVPWLLPRGASACVVGVLPARLALPADFDERFSAEERELILAHEDVHLCRRDNLWNLLAALCCCLQWFNPLCWWAWRRMRADQELACDAAVLIERRTPVDLHRYGQALVRSHEQAARALLPTLSSPWRSRHDLVERVAQLQAHADRRGARRRGRGWVAALVMSTAATVAVSGALQQPAAMPAVSTPMAQPPALDAAPDEPSMLRWRLQSRENGQLVERSTRSTVLMHGPGPGGQTLKHVEKLNGVALWCMELGGDRFNDGSWRFTGRLMDAQCKEFLAAPRELRPDGSVHRFDGRLADGGPLEIELSAMRFPLPADMVWVDIGIDHNLKAVSSAGMRLLGKQGAAMRIESRPQPGDDRQTLAVEITVLAEGASQARVKARLLLGEQRLLLGQPEIVTTWGTPATVVWEDPANGQRVSLRLNPHRAYRKP
jgi:beta-lactamase regulating signal transducer with metallopeptidase domain